MPIGFIKRAVFGGGRTQLSDPRETARRQEASNDRTFRRNLASQAGDRTSTGSKISFKRNPNGVGYSAEYTLTDDLLDRYKGGENLQDQIRGAASRTLSALAPGTGPSNIVDGTAGQTARDQVLDVLDRRNQERFDRERSSLEAGLAARGIRLGSQAHADAVRGLDQARSDAADNAFLTAGQEATRQAQEEALRATAAKTTADSARQDLATLLGSVRYQDPLDASQLGTPSATLAGTDVAGITSRADNAALARKQQEDAATADLVGGILGAIPGVGQVYTGLGALNALKRGTGGAAAAPSLAKIAMGR